LIYSPFSFLIDLLFRVVVLFENYQRPLKYLSQDTPSEIGLGPDWSNGQKPFDIAEDGVTRWGALAL
jgi:hypothetical protein